MSSLNPKSSLTYQKFTLAECEAQDEMLAPFRLSFEELEEEVDRAERDGVCSEEVAEVAREEIVDLDLHLGILIMRKVRLQNWIRAAENASK